MPNAAAFAPPLEPVGERCVLIRLGEQPADATQQLVHAVSAHIEACQLPGVLEVVPAFTTVAVHFDPMAYDWTPGRPSATAQLIALLRAALLDTPQAQTDSGRTIDIPACYEGEYAPDLHEVAAHCGLTPSQVVERHCASPLRVWAFYFAPGNPFAGPVDASLQIGRKRTPRLKVMAGSVGLANGVTSIYAATSPGGWNIIARTPWRMFDVRNTPPTRLQLGDRLRFQPISEHAFRAMQEAQ